MHVRGFSGIAIAVTILLLGILVGVVLSASFPSALSPSAVRMTGPLPALYTEEQMINDLRKDSIDLKDTDAVFDFVFSQLPDSVRVYPTENYYYFQFYGDGQNVWGNIRLEYEMRKEGKASFAYFGSIGKPEARTDMDFLSGMRILGDGDGVVVKEAGPLFYSITHKGKTVLFYLNDLSQDLPPGFPQREAEKYFGRMFDESGFQFFLFYDTKHLQFRFVLDETASLPDILEEVSPTLYVGRLSSFAFYKSEGRLTLFGVHADNTRRNNYYDGPFDQLPDNFMKGNDLREALEAAYPYVYGMINERGVFYDQDGKPSGSRVAITPYFSYSAKTELLSFIKYCETGKSSDEILLCLTHDYKKETPARSREALGSSASSASSY